MQAKHPGPRLAIVLLSLLTLLAGCTNAYYIALPQPPGAPTTATPVISPPGGSFSAPLTVTLADATTTATIYYTTNGTTPTTSSTVYTAPIAVATSEPISAIATAPGYTASAIATADYVISIPSPQAATPTFTPPAGTYTSAQSVTISDTTPNTTIYYTTNGTTPTTSSTLYTGPITVSASETIEAIAVAPGYQNSLVATAAYIISIPLPQAAAPTFTPPAGTYTSAQSVTISDTTPGATIYYTTNGTTPTTSSTLYTGPITVSAPETIEAIAAAPGYQNSLVGSATYVIQYVIPNCVSQSPGIICTIAGDGTAGYSGDGGPATSAALYTPWGVALDASGNLYIGDPNGSRVRKVTPAGIISTVAGDGLIRSFGDGGPATSAGLNGPAEVALDSAGNLYIADEGCPCIRMVNTAGIISTFAGNYFFGNSGDGGPATSAELYGPIGVKFDATGNLYIADRLANKIRKVTPAGIISTAAGNGTPSSTGDGGPATSAALNQPYDVAFDATGNMYISEGPGARIRKVTPAGVISTFAGDGASGYAGDGGPAISAQLNNPHGIAFDPAGNLYIADVVNYRIRQVTPAGIISTVVGTGIGAFGGDNGPAISAQLFAPEDIVFDPAGNMYIGDWGNHRVREVFNSTTAAPTFTPPAGTYTSTQTITVASTTPNATIYYTTNGTTPTTSSTVYTAPITVASSESIQAIAIAPGYTASPVATAAYIIQAATPGSCVGLPSGSICTVAGNGVEGFAGDGGPATSAEVFEPTGVALDSSGNLYIADTQNFRMRLVTASGIISTVAGDGIPGTNGDGGSALSASILLPGSVAVDSTGNFYFNDPGGARVRKVTPAGIISTVAGTGTAGYSGDGGPATSAALGTPRGVALDSSGNLYIADQIDNCVRMVTPAGIISTVAGTGVQGFSGDGGPASSAKLANPESVAIDPGGNLYIADSYNERIRKVTPAGIISTFAGNGSVGFSGDGGAATSAKLSSPYGVGVDSSGNLYIADAANCRIRKVTPAGLISTVAGNGTACSIGSYTGDGGPATGAELSYPQGVAVDSFGNLYIADSDNSRIRKVIH